MSDTNTHVVTGAFGFTGRYITQHLLDRGIRVRTLTNRQARNCGFVDRIKVEPLDFKNPTALCQSLRGADVLYNTYWIRFGRGSATHGLAIENSKTLFRCAAEAGVRRIVHVSIANADEESPYSYFRGKALVEHALIESGLSYAILRPAVLFGHGDILINNIAWMLKHLPIFGVFGRGQYRLQPVHVNDLAALGVDCAFRTDSLIVSAVGPETFQYEDLIRLIRRETRGRARIIHMPPTIGLAIGRFLGWWLGDAIITRPEVEALMDDLLVTADSATCPTRFTDWLRENAEELGRKYASELSRHYRR